MKAGYYTLDLYCDDCGRKDQFTHELGSACRRIARKVGWVIGAKDVCPVCRGAKMAG